MKRIVFVVALGAGLCVAQRASAAEDWTERCKSISSLAATIMKGRQAGVSMSSMMDVTVDADIKNLTTSMVMDAYEKPRYSTEKVQQETISDFRDDWYLKCAQAYGK
jgi:hypothetical protein